MNIYHNSFYAMGTRFNIVLPNCNEEVCVRLFNLMQAECKRIEWMLSYFDSASDVFKINESASKSFVPLDDELSNIIKICLEYARITSGAFDITIRPVIEYLGSNSSVTDEEVMKSYLNQIELNNEEKSIHFKSNKVKIDFGGFGKGYALEKIKPLLNRSSIGNAFISFGESSIMVKGKRPDGNDWQVGIKDILDKENSLHTFSFSDSSISTSSNYYVDDAGQLCKKINVISPFTKKPVEDVSVVSVKSDSPLQAEILSTAFLVMDDEQIFETIKKLNNVEAVKIFYNENKPLVKYYK
jgi:FAD:protein FMN transferase